MGKRAVGGGLCVYVNRFMVGRSEGREPGRGRIRGYFEGVCCVYIRDMCISGCIQSYTDEKSIGQELSGLSTIFTYTHTYAQDQAYSAIFVHAYVLYFNPAGFGNRTGWTGLVRLAGPSRRSVYYIAREPSPSLRPAPPLLFPHSSKTILPYLHFHRSISSSYSHLYTRRHVWTPTITKAAVLD